MPTVIVGEKVTLQATFGEVPMTGVRWTIAGAAVGGYTQSKAKAEVKALTEEDLTATPLVLHWIEAGVFDVTATGNEGTSTETYTVLGPTAVSMTSKTHEVGIRQVETIVGKRPHLQLGDESKKKPGIRWECKATAPATRKGEIACTQLIRLNRVRSLGDGSKEGLVSDGFVLDEVVHYNVWLPMEEDVDDEELDEVFTVEIAKGKADVLISEDSPGTLLGRQNRDRKQIDAAEVDEAFRTYFCFKSGRAESIWVTLMRLDWSWSGKATYDVESSKWVASSCAATPDPSGVPHTVLPVWTTNKETLETDGWKPQ